MRFNIYEDDFIMILKKQWFEIFPEYKTDETKIKEFERDYRLFYGILSEEQESMDDAHIYDINFPYFHCNFEFHTVESYLDEVKENLNYLIDDNENYIFNVSDDIRGSEKIENLDVLAEDLKKLDTLEQIKSMDEKLEYCRDEQMYKIIVGWCIDNNFVVILDEWYW